jgi:hypothetical protein
MTVNDLIEKGNLLFERIDRRDTHLSNYYALQDFDETIELVKELEQLEEQIPHTKVRATSEELYANELKRLCSKGSVALNAEVSAHISTPLEVIDRFSVKKEDLDKIKEWLLQNRQNVIEANKFLYKKYAPIKKSEVEVGDPLLRKKAEDLLLEKIENIKEILKTHPQFGNHFTNIFNTYHISVTSQERRSFANRVSRIACLSVAKHTYMAKKEIYFEPHNFISTFGHEVLGHCSNYYMSDNSNLPFFIRFGFFTLTSATREAVSDYYEDRIYDYLKDCPNLSELFNGEYNFEEIEELRKAVKLLRDYQSKLYSVAVWVLAQSKMDNSTEQIEEISKYSIEKKYASNFVNSRRNDWNRATGLLLPNVVSELRYAVDVISPELIPTKKDLKEFEMKILTGMWTPEGMREYLTLS